MYGWHPPAQPCSLGKDDPAPVLFKGQEGRRPTPVSHGRHRLSSQISQPTLKLWAERADAPGMAFQAFSRQPARKSAIRRVALFAVLCSALSPLVSAKADSWGTNTSDTGPHPDGSFHSWCWGNGVDSDLHNNVINVEDNALDGPTQATEDFHTNCNYSSSTETDVVWFTENLPAGTRGRNFCENFEGGVCDQNYTSLDLAEIAIGDNDELDETKTACHELGHSVGLTHGAADDCMINGERPVRPAYDVTFERYNPHHIGHIDAWF